MFTDSVELRVTKAPKRASDTRQAEPIAKPLPIAAVVFPAASSASVLFLAHSFAFAISQIPPALSDIGPKPSMVRHVVKVLSIPMAASEIPNMLAIENDTKIEIATQKTGITVDL